MAVRRELQARTQKLHAFTEGLYWSGSGFHDYQRYIFFLGAILKAHSDLGMPAALRHGDRLAVDHEQNSILALQQDLGTAGRAPDNFAGQNCDADYAWGVRYALTGSHIGASVILKSRGVGDAWPQSYLRRAQAFAQSGGVRDFFETLDAAAPDVTRATLGAKAVFKCLSAGHADNVSDQARPLMQV